MANFQPAAESRGPAGHRAYSPKRQLRLGVRLSQVYFNRETRYYCLELELLNLTSRYLYIETIYPELTFHEPGLDFAEVNLKAKSPIKLAPGLEFEPGRILNRWQQKSLPPGKPVRGVLILETHSTLAENTFRANMRFDVIIRVYGAVGELAHVTLPVVAVPLPARKKQSLNLQAQGDGDADQRRLPGQPPEGAGLYEPLPKHKPEHNPKDCPRSLSGNNNKENWCEHCDPKTPPMHTPWQPDFLVDKKRVAAFKALVRRLQEAEPVTLEDAAIASQPDSVPGIPSGPK